MSFEDGQDFEIEGCIALAPVETDFYKFVKKHTRSPLSSFLFRSTEWKLHFFGDWEYVSEEFWLLFINIKRSELGEEVSEEDCLELSDYKKAEILALEYFFCKESIVLLKNLQTSPRVIIGETNPKFGKYLVRLYNSALENSGYYVDPFKILRYEEIIDSYGDQYTFLELRILDIGNKFRLRLDSKLDFKKGNEYQFLIDYLEKRKEKYWLRILLETRKISTSEVEIM
jgi:hypothetical protein